MNLSFENNDSVLNKISYLIPSSEQFFFLQDLFFTFFL